MRAAQPAPHKHDGKVLSEVLPVLALHERDQLRMALRHRQRELSAALRLYEEVAIHSVPRMALIERTEAALTEIGDALIHLDDHRYGICTRCLRTLRIQTLTLRPLGSHCDRCSRFETNA